MASKVSAVVSAWKSFDFLGLQKDLDSEAIALAQRQDESETSRRRLVEQSREFKRSISEEIRVAVAPLLKSFQNEVDSLNKRSKAAEMAFLAVYKHLGDVTDPLPWLEMIPSLQQKVSKVQDLEAERKQLKETLAEYEEEFSQVRNQDVTIKQLREKLRQAEENTDEAVEARLADFQTQFRKEFAERERELTELQKLTERKLMETESRVTSMQMLVNELQSELLDTRSRLDEAAHAKSKEVELLLSDLERANQRAALAEKEVSAFQEQLQQVSTGQRQGATTAPGQLVTQGRGHNQERDVHTPPAANMDTPLDMLARPSLQLELAAKEKEVQSLLEDIQRLQTSLAQLRESSARQLSLLEEQLEARARHIQRLEAQLEEQKNYQEMKRELSILKSIEFPGLAGMESSPGKPLEVLLLERSKALQSENASLKLNNADMQGSLRKPGNVSPPPASSSALPQAAPTSSSSSSGIRSSPWSTSTTTAAPNLPPGVTSPLPHFSSMPRGFPPVFHPSLGPFGSLLTDDVMLSWRRSLEASMINQHHQQQHAQQLSHSHQQQQSQSRSPERDSRRSPTPRSCVPTSHGADNSNSVEQHRERERDSSPDAAAASPRHRARSAEESRDRERDSRPDDNEQHPPAGLNCHNPVNHSATSAASSAAAEAAAAVAAQNNHHSHHPHYQNHVNQAGLGLTISKNTSEPNHGAPYANPRLLPSHQHPWPWDYRLEDMPLPLQNLLARSAAAAAEDQMTPLTSLPEGLTSLLAKSNPLEARLQEMLRATMERYSTHALDTLAISRGVRELLSLHNIGQRLFAKFVLGLSQGTVSELLSKPKPWDKLTEKGRDSYRKMHAWACDEAAILLLKSLIPRKGKEAGLGTPSRNEENVATEERIAHILSEATASLRQQPINEDQQSDDSKPPSQAQTPSPGPRPDGISNGNLTEAQRRLRKYENDDISQEQVMRIYQEELAKLMGVSFGNPAAAAAMANFNFGHLPRSFAQHYQRLAASSMFDRSPEEIRMALDVYQQELSRLIPPSAFPHHGNAAQGSGNLPPPTLPNGTVQDLSVPKTKAEEEALKSSSSKEEKDNMDKCEDNKSPGNPARVKTETGVSTPGPNATPSPYPLSMPSPMSSHQPTQSILYPGMSPSPEDSVGMGGGVASPLQRMASITNSLMSQPAHPNTPSSAQRPMKPVLPPITQQQFDAYQNLNTEDIVKRVKEQLSQYSISQRLFGESVLGLSQGSVSDLLARPKPWHMLTQKGREPFIRMKLFLEDENAVHKLVASQYKIAPEKLMRTGGYANSPQIGGGKNPKLGSPQDMSLFHGHRPHLHNAMDFHPLNAGTSPVPHLSPGLPFPHLGQMPFPGAVGLNFPPVSMASRLPSLSPLSRLKSEKEDIKAGGGKSGGGGAAAAAALASAASSPSANTGGAGGGFGQQHTPTREHFALDNHGEGSPMPNLPFPCEYPAHSVYEMAALTQDLDTQLTTTRIKEVLLANNIGQKIFGEAVLGLSQGSVSELLSKPKPWHMLSIKGREPFIRMQLWLSDARNIEKLQRLKNQRREAGKRRRETLDGSSNPNAPTQSAETSSNDSQDNNDSVSATKKQRVLFSEPQKEALKLAYTLDPYPSTSTIEFLSNELGLSTRTITNWFHNHRMRLKQQTGNQNAASESSPLLASLEQLQQQSGGDLNGREGQWDPMKFRLLLNQRLLELEAVEGNFPLGGFPPGFPAGLTYHPFYATGMLSQFCMGLTAEQANNPHSGLDLTINKDFDGDRDADADADAEMNEGDQEHEAGSSEYDSGLSTPSPRPVPHCESSASPAMANVHRNRPEVLRPELTVERSSRRSRKPAAPQWVNPQWQEPEEDKEDNGDKKEEILINGVCVLQTSEDNNNGKVAVVPEAAIRSEDVEDSPEPSSSVKTEPVESNEDL